MTACRQQREAKGLSQAELGRAARLDQAQISRIENGHRVPTLEQAMRLAEALGLSAPDTVEFCRELAGLPPHCELHVGELVVRSLVPMARSPQEVTAQLVELFTSLADDADSAGGWYEEVSGPNEDTVACEARARLLRTVVARLQASVPAAAPAPPPASPDASDLAPTPTPIQGAA